MTSLLNLSVASFRGLSHSCTMPKVRIYRPDKTAMQSGKAKTKAWLLEPVSDSKLPTDPLMGWTGMNDTSREIRLKFSTKEAAIGYAQANQLEYEVIEPKPRHHVKKAYADNFAFDRYSPLTSGLKSAP